MPSPFQAAAPTLRANGYSVVPLVAREKRILIADWSAYCTEAASDEVFDNWMRMPSSNVGVCLGAASGLTALDFDNDVDGLHARIVRIVGDSPVKKAGAKGFTAFYRFGNERSSSYSAPGVRVLDVLASGRQTVMPPSVHPGGPTYQWLTERTLENTQAWELPAITSEALVEVMRLFRTDPPVIKHAYRDGFNFDSADDVAEALKHVHADDYDRWVEMGMALKDAFGERGFPLYDAWSATGVKYEGSGATRKKWESFKKSGVGLGTLFHHAFQGGYVRRRNYVEYAPIEPGGNLEKGGGDGIVEKSPDKPGKTTAWGGEENLELLRNRILDAPGLPGMVAGYINQSALYPQPLLALGASLAFSGLLMAHKVRGETGLRTNIYTLGVAESGAGKDHARQACKALLAQSNLSHLEIGVPASGASLKTVLVERDGKALALIDEFGKFFGNITARNSGSHQQEITGNLMELFTSSAGTWVGKMYADAEKNPSKTVIQPCLCMYPVTTPDTFYGSLSIKDAVDGLLARFLVFESKDYPTQEQEDRRDANDVPQTLRDMIEFWKQFPVNHDAGSNMGHGWIAPKVIPYCDEARRIRKEYTERNKEKAKAEIARGNPFGPIYGRVGEIAGKVALIGHAGENISTEVMEWAIAVTTYCSEYMVQVVRKVIGENEHERNFKRLVGIVAKLCDEKGEAMHSEVIRKAQFLTRKDRLDMLEDAVIGGFIVRDSKDKSGKPGPTAVYYTMGKHS